MTECQAYDEHLCNVVGSSAYLKLVAVLMKPTWPKQLAVYSIGYVKQQVSPVHLPYLIKHTPPPIDIFPGISLHSRKHTGTQLLFKVYCTALGRSGI